MTLADAAHLAVVVAVVMLVAGGIGAALVVTRVRRRWRRRHWLLRSLSRPPGAFLPASRVGGALADTVGSPSWWLMQRDRHAMWRSVSAARRAVAIAVRAGAPVGDLPALTRQLQRAARGVDAALRAGGSGRAATSQTGKERERIQASAAEVRAAAVAALAATTDDVENVTSAIAIEVAAVAEGVRSAGLARLPAR